jgi:hypothetical protein
MQNEELRKALRMWSRSGQIERYRVPVVSHRVQMALAWLLMGSFSGFIVGFVLGIVLR